MCLDIPDSDSEENDSDFDDEFDAPVPNPPPQNLRAPAPRAAIPAIPPARSRNLWVVPKINFDDEFDGPVPNPPLQNLRIPAPRATIPAIFPARCRNLWVGNDPKINLVASKFRGQPLKQELAANTSGSQDLVAKNRSLKRDPTQDFDYGNLKHSENKFLMEKTTAELNDCAKFQVHMPVGPQLLPRIFSPKNEGVFRHRSCHAGRSN